jgi:tetratricopeptide (TPR) repeat protein
MVAAARIGAVASFAICLAAPLVLASLSGTVSAGEWEDCAKRVDLDRSITACTLLIESGRESGENLALAYHNRGNNYYMKGDYDPAISDYAEAIRLAPDRALSYSSRGFAYAAKSDNIRALADFNEAVRLNPKDGINYQARGVLYAVDASKIELAIADFRKALSLDPSLETSRDLLKKLGAKP